LKTERERELGRYGMDAAAVKLLFRRHEGLLARLAALGMADDTDKARRGAKGGKQKTCASSPSAAAKQTKADTNSEEANADASRAHEEAEAGGAAMLCVSGGAGARECEGINDDECPLCLTDWAELEETRVLVLGCRHMVCGPCMLEWARQAHKQEGAAAVDREVQAAIEKERRVNINCPYCRAPVDGGLRAVSALLDAPTAGSSAK